MNRNNFNKLIFCLFFTSVFACTNVFSQEAENGHIEVDGITGFYNIEFGTSKADVQKIMKEKGWKLATKGTEKGLGEFLEFKGGTYASKKIGGLYNYVIMYFHDDRMYIGQVHLSVTDTSWARREEEKWVNDCVSNIVAKYNLEQIDKGFGSVSTDAIFQGKNSNIFSLNTKRFDTYSSTVYTLEFKENSAQVLFEAVNSNDDL